MNTSVSGPTGKPLLRFLNFTCRSTPKKVAKDKIATPTLDKYKYACAKVKSFLRHHYKISDIYLDEIQPSFVHDFEHFLLTTAELANNSAMKYIRQSKTILIMATDRGWLKVNPLASFNCTFDEKDPLLLKIDELNRVGAKRFAIDRLAEARDGYAENLAGFASSKLYCLEDARDVIHDVFVKLWTDRKELKVRSNLKSYLFKAVRYRIIDKIRRNITRNRPKAGAI